MRICLAHPTWWPEVRRGSERLLNDLATELARRGHEVILLTSHRARHSVEQGSFSVVRVRRPRPLPPLRHYEDHLDSAAAMLVELRRLRPDLVHSFHPGWNWAAAAGRRLLPDLKLVASLHGIPTRGWLVGRRRRIEMAQRVGTGADAVTVLSEAAAQTYEQYLLRRPRILPGGVDIGAFDPGRAERAAAPTLVSAASLGDPRKRADLIFGAFAELRERMPEARLLVVGTDDPHLSPERPALPDGAQLVSVTDAASLAAAYAAGWSSVLAADGEAFGLVLLESMAAGTPVIAPASGGCEDLLEPGCGRSFEPGDRDSLREAMAAALEAPPAAETGAACRAAAERWSWPRIGDRYEDLYRELSDG